MITGFNTDIEHDGVVYHVQTEDKGLDSPLILSLVYSGGAILASKRSRYEDLIAAGFDEEVLTQRLKRQHRLICAAINAGRLEELKRMGAPPERERRPSDTADLVMPGSQSVEVNQAEQIASNGVGGVEADVDDTVEIPRLETVPATPDAIGEDEQIPGTARVPGEESAYTVYDPRRQAPPFDEVVIPEIGLTLTLLDDDDFRAGHTYNIRVLLEDCSGKKAKPLGGMAVSLKILGTTFRPQIYSVKTSRDGVATIPTAMPGFTSGRAAVLIQTVVKGKAAELRRVIHAAERRA